MKGIVIKPKGTDAIASTPNNLFGNTRNKLKVGKKYHSGKISNGVLNGSAGSPNWVGAITANPIQQANVPKIHTGKTYNKSFGQAGWNLIIEPFKKEMQKSVPEPYVQFLPHMAL